jgi:hypothetical protein
LTTVDHFDWSCAPITDASDHIIDGKIMFKLEHDGNGVPSHKLEVEMIYVTSGFASNIVTESDPHFSEWYNASNPTISNLTITESLSNGSDNFIISDLNKTADLTNYTKNNTDTEYLGGHYTGLLYVDDVIYIGDKTDGNYCLYFSDSGTYSGASLCYLLDNKMRVSAELIGDGGFTLGATKITDWADLTTPINQTDVNINLLN